MLTLVDQGGRRWLVRDGVLEGGKFVPGQLGDSYASFRVFDQLALRERRVYRFRPDEQRGVNEPALQRHFLAAQALR